MPITKRPLMRYNILDRCFSNSGRNYTFNDLLEAVRERMQEIDPGSDGVSVRQLREDIAFMKSSEGWDAPIVTVPGRGQKRYYRYEDPGFSIAKRAVNETQVEELKMAMDVLSDFEGLPGFEGLEDLIFKLKADMDLATGESKKKLIDWGENRHYKGREFLTPLYGAVQKRKQIKMTYTPFNKPSATFVTNPLYIKQYNNRWFLVAMAEPDGFVFINAFDRIDEVQVLDDPIPNTISFDPEDYFDPIIGVSRPLDGELERIEIFLTPEQYPYVKTKPLHHSQINYDNECKVVIKVIRNRELEMLLRQYGL